MITVFYDGKCGLCSKEIRYYRRIAPQGVFDWQDITHSSDSLRNAGVTLSQGLKLLHAKDHNNQMHVGVDAFILIWKQLPKWKILAKIVSLPLIYHVVTWYYGVFANWRFKRLAHCQLAAKEDQHR